MKLVRDKIHGLPAEEHARWGLAGATFHQAGPTERLLLLRLKLAEEAGEVLSAPNDEQFLRELADLLDVVDALREAQGWSAEHLESFRQAKRAWLGGFEEGWVLE